MDIEIKSTIKIKEEKFDPQIEQRIKELVLSNRIEPCSNVQDPVSQADHDDATEHACEESSSSSSAIDDKKSIEPVKTSNEILAELFKVFNAAPPKELLDGTNLLRNRKHKKHKHKQEKKKKHKKIKSDVEQDPTKIGIDELPAHEKHKHKKKKKHKKDEKKERKNDKVKTFSNDISEESNAKKVKEKLLTHSPRIKEEPVDERKKDSSNHKRSRVSNETNEICGSAPKTRCLERSRYLEKHRERSSRNSFYNGDGDRDRVKRGITDLHNEPKRHGHVSDISLSDEESYLRECERAGDSRRNNNGIKSRSHKHNSFYDGIDSIRSPKRRDLHRPNRYRNSWRRNSSSRSRSRDLGIDKKRLLEIARKNAISMFKRGSMPGCTDLTEEIKDKVLLKMRYGGRTVQDLTDFCKKISNGENLSGLSSDEDSDVDKSGNAKAFHHPFLLKDREPIVMHIRNSKPRVPGEDLTKAITMQFPVSSGQQHRISEVWVPVEAKEKLTPLPLLPKAMQSTNMFKKIDTLPTAPAAAATVPKNVFQKPMPAKEQQEPAFKNVLLPESTEASHIPLPSQPLTIQHDTNIHQLLIEPTAITNTSPSVPSVIATPPLPTQFVPDVPVPSTATSNECSVFPQISAPTMDVSSIISKRLNAMRRLQDNPLDSEAIKMMHNSQRDMTSWASSKHLPGQFTGSTGVNVLKAHELNSGPQLWVRRDQLTSTRPVTGGMGMHLLQKMGWKPGEGLGREKTGALQPLLLDVKLDKRGLVSKEDVNKGYQQPPPLQQQSKKQRYHNASHEQNDFQNKHPVCLLNEMSSKQKWQPPLYNLVNEVGPSHNKMFLFSVDINGQTFTPPNASNTKKEAKLFAARHCLQQIGILPP